MISAFRLKTWRQPATELPRFAPHRTLEGHSMLSLSVVQEIDRLLREGQLSQRSIARKLGVSRGIIAAIAKGKRGLHGRETQVEPDQLARSESPQRCLGCGGLVYVPCVLCHVTAYLSMLQKWRTRPGRWERPGRWNSIPQ